ncbi:unnamed protein product [Arctogadus glacialis]
MFCELGALGRRHPIATVCFLFMTMRREEEANCGNRALQAVTAAPPAPAGRSEYQGSEQDGKHFCGNNPPLNIKKVCLPVKNYIRRKICLVTLALVQWIL